MSEPSVPATGASAAVRRLVAVIAPATLVSGSAKTWVTRVAGSITLRAAAMARLSAEPLPARPSPRPVTALWIERRVGWSKMSSAASSSVAGSDWRMGSVSPAARKVPVRPGYEIDVLGAERGAGPHLHRGVAADRPDSRVDAQREPRERRLVVGGRHGLDVLDHADPCGTDPDIAVGLDQLGGVGNIGGDLVDRHQRQAAARVVGDRGADHTRQDDGQPDQRGPGEPAGWCSWMCRSSSLEQVVE